ncbi:MAG: invasion associated locus B family protein [Devosia sp.]
MLSNTRLILAMLVIAAGLGGLAVAIGTGSLKFGGTPTAAAASTAQTSSVMPSAEVSVAAPVAAASSETPAMAAADAPAARQIGDWIYSCATPAGGSAAVCAITQQLNDPKSNALLFQWQIVRNANGLVSVWQSPTGVLVDHGLVLVAGTPKPIAVPFRACNARNCDAVANLAADFQASLAGAKALSVTVTSTDGTALEFKFSPNGLADALAALKG